MNFRQNREVRRVCPGALYFFNFSQQYALKQRRKAEESDVFIFNILSHLNSVTNTLCEFVLTILKIFPL